MANRGFALRIALAVILLLLATNIVSPFVTIYLLTEPERVAVVDEPGNIHYLHLRKYRDAMALYRLCAQEATYAAFMRSPQGPDDPDMVGLLYTKSAGEKLAKLIAEESADFSKFQFHQKVEIGKWTFEPAGDDNFRATARLQLIKTGVANERPRTEVRTADLILYLFRNPDIATNRKYPVGVWDFELAYQQ